MEPGSWASKRLFEPADLRQYLGYYLDRINEDDEVPTQLRKFIEVYRYKGVQKLVTEVTGEPWRIVEGNKF